jgi:hypothetical protein
MWKVASSVDSVPTIQMRSLSGSREPVARSNSGPSAIIVSPTVGDVQSRESPGLCHDADRCFVRSAVIDDRNVIWTLVTAFREAVDRAWH